MRLMDRYLGVVACWLLTGHRHTVGRLLGRGQVQPPQAILLIKLWGLGSVLLTGPVQRALKQAYPQAKLIFLTFAQNRWAAEALGLADEVWTIGTRGLLGALSDLSTVLRRCRREHVDLALDLEFFSRLPAVLTYLSGAPRRLGYWARGKSCGDLFTDRCAYNPYRHVTEIFGALAELAGAPCDAATPVAPRVEAADLASVRDKLRAAGLADDAAFVVLSPNVSDFGAELRRWPQERWAELADRLRSEAGLPCVMVGAPSDVAYVDGIAALCAPATGVHSLAGQTSMGELAAVLSLAGALAACDSGPVALAACLDTPTVALFSTETPVLYGPRGPHHRVIYKGLYCSPCLSVFNDKVVDFTCDNRCMQDITVSEVLAAVREIARIPGRPEPAERR